MTPAVIIHFLDAFLLLLLFFVADGVIGVKVEATTIISYLSGIYRQWPRSSKQPEQGR